MEGAKVKMNEEKLKSSVLDDHADIYQRREAVSEKEKWKQMSKEEKWTYFNSYYRNKLIVLLAAAIFVVYMIYTIASPKPDVRLNAIILNGAMSDETIDQLREEFAAYINLDEEKETLNFDNSFYIDDENFNELTMANQQKLMAYLSAGEIDIIIAPEKDMVQYASMGGLVKVTDLLPTSFVSTLAKDFYYEALEEETQSAPYGIYLEDMAIYDNSGNLIIKPVLGIVSNSENKETSVEFIQYLFQLK